MLVASSSASWWFIIMIIELSISMTWGHTVDGRNPAPLWMVKTLWIMGCLPPINWCRISQPSTVCENIYTYMDIHRSTGIVIRGNLHGIMFSAQLPYMFGHVAAGIEILGDSGQFHPVSRSSRHVSPILNARVCFPASHVCLLCGGSHIFPPLLNTLPWDCKVHLSQFGKVTSPKRWAPVKFTLSWWWTWWTPEQIRRCFPMFSTKQNPLWDFRGKNSADFRDARCFRTWWSVVRCANAAAERCGLGMPENIWVFLMLRWAMELVTVTSW